MSRMFGFINKSWNPVRYCCHHCPYCWAVRYGLEQQPIIHQNQLERQFRQDDFVFVCSLGDLFCRGVPKSTINLILEKIRAQDSHFLFMTKNPARYLEFFTDQGDDSYGKARIVLGTTMESDLSYPTLGKAPSNPERWEAMAELYRSTNYPLFVSVEPVLEFNLSYFTDKLCRLKPWKVAVGYDNYGHQLNEPCLAKTEELIRILQEKGIDVVRKTLRPAWDEQPIKVEA